MKKFNNPYRSGFEYKIALHLEARGIDFKYEDEALGYTVPERDTWYTPDFFLPNGIIVEAKGRFTAADRKKMLLVTQQWPELDIRMLFLKNNTINKNSKTRYSDWCDKHKIKYAFGMVPEEWLK